MAIEAAAELIRHGDLELTIVGDGPERAALESLADSLGAKVRFVGWVPQAEVHTYLGSADLFLFPSVREFGGGVGPGAMAMGAVPLIVNYGGPAETGDARVRLRRAHRLAGSDCRGHPGSPATTRSRTQDSCVSVRLGTGANSYVVYLGCQGATGGLHLPATRQLQRGGQPLAALTD